MLVQSAANSPNVDDEEEARCRYSQLQLAPVPYEVRHPGQEDVPESEEVVCDNPGQHALSQARPFSTWEEGTDKHTAKHALTSQPSPVFLSSGHQGEQLCVF